MKRRMTYLFLTGIVILFLLSSSSLVNIYTDWLFFDGMHYQTVFIKSFTTQLFLGLIFGVFSFIFLTLNVIIASRIEFAPIDLFFDGQTSVSLNLNQLSRWIKPLTVAIVLAVSFFAGILGSSLWNEFLLFQNGVPVGISDPVYGKNIGFYLFTLPWLESIRGFLSFIIFAVLFIVLFNYLLRGGVIVRERRLSADRRVKSHLGFLCGLFIMNIAFGFYLDQFNLLYSQHSVLVGVSYADIHARISILRILAVLSVFSGILVIIGMVRGSWKLALAPLGLTVILYAVGYMAYPALLQNFKVTPNELDLEKPYIENHIKFTRFGYDLDRIKVTPFDVSYDLTAGDIERNNATIKNIRLWDDAPLLKTYGQLQQIRTYYSFKDVDNDRYTLNGEYMQVMLSPRELASDNLPSKSWINERIVFTHGFGISMGPVSRISGEGLPEFIIKDIPPVSSSPDIKITKPEIYFGELSSDYAIVKTKVPEFNYPTSEGNVYTSYEGSGGVPLSSLFRKAAFAMKFRSEKILLSSDITSGSKILYYRNIVERVRKLAPFLIYDADPYIVVSKDGKLFWMIDAYTISNMVPYAKPLNNRINYMRNAVKVVIGAYDGSVSFYVSDPEDVIIKAYQKIFPDLFLPMSGMAADLKEHVRYPKGFLQIQASMFSTYHMTDSKVFYNKEDLWEIPAYGDKSIDPYYTIMKLPEGKKVEYILLLPYTPSKRDNLAAWIAGRCDEPNYGNLVVYTFPRDRLVFGPRQIDARIDQDSYISQQLTLWGQRGSSVIRGSLLIIPIGKSLLYVQPLYLAAEDKGGLPELRRVILAYGNNVVMEENLELGLQHLFGGKVAAPVAEKALTETGGANTLARDAMKTYDRLNDMLRQGNWAGYGEELKKLGQILKKMAK